MSTRSRRSPRSPRSPPRGATRSSVVKLDSDAVGTMLQAAQHAEEIHTLRRQHAAEMAELRDRVDAAEAECKRWEVRSTQLVARLEQEQLRLASLKLAERMHGSAVDASRLRAESMTQRLADASELVRQAELQAASHRALQLAAQDEAAAAQAELQQLRRRGSSSACDLIALPALRLEDPEVRPPSSDEWLARFSTRFRRWYWYHERTFETRWEWPTEVLNSAPCRELHFLLGVQQLQPTLPSAVVSSEPEIEEGQPDACFESSELQALATLDGASRARQKRRKKRTPAAESGAPPCDSCAALRRKVRKLTRKLKQVEAQKKEMGQKATALQESVAAFEVELEDTIQKIVEGIEEHYEAQIEDLRHEIQAMQASSRRGDRERERLERQLQLQEDEYVVLVERTNSFSSPPDKSPPEDVEDYGDSTLVTQPLHPEPQPPEHEESDDEHWSSSSGDSQDTERRWEEEEQQQRRRQKQQQQRRQQQRQQRRYREPSDELSARDHTSAAPIASVRRARQGGKSPPTRLRGGPRGKRTGNRPGAEAARAKATGELKRQLAGLRRASMEMDPDRMLAGLHLQSPLSEDEGEVDADHQADRRQRQHRRQQQQLGDDEDVAPTEAHEQEYEGTRGQETKEQEKDEDDEDDDDDDDGNNVQKNGHHHQQEEREQQDNVNSDDDR